MGGTGDGLQPSPPHPGRLCREFTCTSWERAVSHRAIAAALALEDVSIGERLVAFSLASFAGRDCRAWPAARTAAARAGLSRGRYLAGRARLIDRGLLTFESTGPTASSSSTVRLGFAEQGAVIGREINAELFEAVLVHSSVSGSARALLGALAALAGPANVVAGLGVEELCEAAGLLSDRTYRRARTELLEGGAVTIRIPGGGRARQNEWRVQDPRQGAAASLPAQGRARASSRPQLDCGRAAAAVSRPSGEEGERGRANWAAGRVSRRLDGAKNPGVNPGQNGTPQPETPAETPAQTPARYARVGRESRNLESTRPPDPPEGGLGRPVRVIEPFVSDRGRRRTRTVQVDPDELTALTARDRELWPALRVHILDAVGATAFEVWLSTLTPLAVSAVDGALVLATSRSETQVWVRGRYRQLFTSLDAIAGRPVRLASDRELALHHALSPAGCPSTDPAGRRPADPAAGRAPAASSRPDRPDDHQEAI